MGSIVGAIESKECFRKILQNRLLQICFLIIAFIIINRPESEATYYIDGIASVVIVLITNNNEKIQKILSNKHTAQVGKKVIAIFLIHTVVYTIVGRWIMNCITNIPYILSFLIALIISWFLIILLAGPLMKAINWSTQRLTACLYTVYREKRYEQ